jgi:anti-sigma factor RsiW
MIPACDLFDRYRDDELDPALREKFESHMTACSGCRSRMALLDNIVNILKQADAPATATLPEQIARRAFHEHRSWDALVISWLKPAPALTALALSVLAFGTLLLAPKLSSIDSSAEYEHLLNTVDSLIIQASDAQIQSDEGLVLWLIQEGNTL